MNRTITVTITRTLDIDVTVGHRPEVAPSWWQPGEAGEWWVESSVDHDGDFVELNEAEAEEAIKLAVSQPDEDPNPIDPEPDPADEQHKPF